MEFRPPFCPQNPADPSSRYLTSLTRLLSTREPPQQYPYGSNPSLPSRLPAIFPFMPLKLTLRKLGDVVLLSPAGSLLGGLKEGVEALCDVLAGAAEVDVLGGSLCDGSGLSSGGLSGGGESSEGEGRRGRGLLRDRRWGGRERRRRRR